MSEQRRKHLRLPIESSTFIELLSSRIEQGDSPKQVSCKTVNVSRGGLQVNVAEELAVGSILKIGVDLPGAASTLYLACEVRWCLPSKNQGNPFLAGLQILNAEDSDLERWMTLIASMEA